MTLRPISPMLRTGIFRFALRLSTRHRFLTPVRIRARLDNLCVTPRMLGVG